MWYYSYLTLSIHALTIIGMLASLIIWDFQLLKNNFPTIALKSIMNGYFVGKGSSQEGSLIRKWTGLIYLSVILFFGMILVVWCIPTVLSLIYSAMQFNATMELKYQHYPTNLSGNPWYYYHHIGCSWVVHMVYHLLVWVLRIIEFPSNWNKWLYAAIVLVVGTVSFYWGIPLALKLVFSLITSWDNGKWEFVSYPSGPSKKK